MTFAILLLMENLVREGYQQATSSIKHCFNTSSIKENRLGMAE